MFKSIRIPLFISVYLLAQSLAAGSGVHPSFNVQSTTEAPFPTDRFTTADPKQNTNQRINLPFPDCTTHPSDCLDVALLNQLDGSNTQPRISIPFDGAIDPSRVTSQTIFMLRIADTLNPTAFHQQTIGINQVVEGRQWRRLYCDLRHIGFREFTT